MKTMDTERTLKEYEIKLEGRKSMQLQKKNFIYDFVFLYSQKNL